MVNNAVLKVFSTLILLLLLLVERVESVAKTEPKAAEEGTSVLPRDEVNTNTKMKDATKGPPPGLLDEFGLAGSVAQAQAEEEGQVKVLPPGLIDETLVTGVDFHAGTFAQMKNGHQVLFAGTSNSGDIYRYDNLQNDDIPTTSELVLSLEVCTIGKRGIISMLDVRFNRRGWLYVMWSPVINGTLSCTDPDFERSNRISRFSYDFEKGVFDPLSELVIFEGPPQIGDKAIGGGLAFGNDGFLYAGIGAGELHKNSTYIDFPAQNVETTLGKVIRLRRGGGQAPSNAFGKDDSVTCRAAGYVLGRFFEGVACREIFAFGFRHPAFIAIDPNFRGPNGETRFIVSDGGFRRYEELNLLNGGDGWASELQNFGWEKREAVCNRNSYSRQCYLIDEQPDFPYIDPLYFYSHHKTIEEDRLYDRPTISGVVVVPNGLGWPDVEDGSIIFSDSILNHLMIFGPSDQDPAYKDAKASPPTSDIRPRQFQVMNQTQTPDDKRPGHVFFGPYESPKDADSHTALYYFTENSLHRIRYDDDVDEAY